jgi:dihydroorotase
MPNLNPPVINVDMARDYRNRILEHRPENSNWQPLMVLYLTDNTNPTEIYAAAESGFVHACKYYPAGATTNSDSGVTNLNKMNSVFEAMQETGTLLLMHGEVTSSDVDIFDREAVFIERHLRSIVDNYPNLKIVLEHITTQQGADFVLNHSDNVGATITPQHLLYNRNHMLVGGIRPHLFCLPILKRDTHQQALISAATSGSHKIFLGTDSAPHTQDAKESCCGCAGCFSHLSAIELYAQVFDQAGALDKLEAFASINGPSFYGLPLNKSRIVLHKKAWQLPDSIPYEGTQLIPLGAGSSLDWQLIE